jgi:CHAT domain-containing protein
MTRFYENLLGIHADSRESGGVQYASGKAMPITDSLIEAKNWLRGLTEAELRNRPETQAIAKDQHLEIGNQIDWFKFLARVRSNRGPNFRNPVALEPAKAAAENRPFANPRYWAAFVLFGAGD